MKPCDVKAAAKHASAVLPVLVSMALCACGPAPSVAVNPAGDAAGASAGALPAAQAVPSAPGRPREADTSRLAVPGEYLVKFRDGAPSSRTSKILRDGALRTVATYRSIPGLRLVRVETGNDGTASTIQSLARDRDVEYIEPNFIVRAYAVPDDPRYPDQWAMKNIGQTQGSSPYFPDLDAEAAWDITTGDDSIVVGVVDTGVDYTHEDLAANMFRNTADCDGDGIDDDGNGHADDCHGIDTVAGDSDPMDERDHGTHVAGTIGAVGNNGIGVAGVAWQVKLLPCRFLDALGEGTTANAIACFDYLAQMKDRGVNLIASNHSWGGPEYSRALEEAIAAHRARGLLVVAAAGNESHDNDVQPAYPCNYPLSNVICVAATYEGITYFSNVGAGTVHLGAPGVFIVSTTPHDTYGSHDGTSMAAPQVTGALVLLAAQDPTRDWRALRNLIITSTVPPQEYGFSSVGGGRLNLLKALTCANSTVLARLQPATFETLHRPPGGSVVIRALHVNCGLPNGEVPVTVAPSGEVVVLRDNGVAPDEVAGDGEYAATWVAPADGDFEFAFPYPEPDTFRVSVDAMLEPGFPVRKNTLTEFDYPPGGHVGLLAVGNIDSDPELEIVADTLHVGPIHVLNHDGSDVPGWPQFQARLSRGLSLGELDGDPAGLEIIANHFFSGTFAYGGQGALLPGWPPQGGYGIDLPAPIVDVDGDGRDEVGLYPLRRADGSEWRADVQVPAISTPQEGPVGMLVVGDLDADGSPDFVTPGGGASLTSLYVSDLNGLRDGFPVQVPAEAEGTPQLLIGDVDGDGSPNVIMPSWRRESTGEVRHQILIFSNRGRLLRTLISEAGSLYASLGDIDGDGIPEILCATTNALHAWRGDGTEPAGWPASITGGDFAGTTHPVIGDVDGDGHPDVVVGARFAGGMALHAIRHDGTSVAGFPKNFWATDGSINTPAIADIDLDGRNELIVNLTSGNGLREAVFVYDTHAAGPYGPLEWPQYMGSAQRRGYYQTGKNLPHHAYVAAQVYGAGDIMAEGGGLACGADCIERYAKGTQVVLRAVPRNGGTFARWRGACAGQGNPCVVDVQRFTETSADFDSLVNLTVTGAGRVNSSVPGISCPGDCNARFAARTPVTLTAVGTFGNDFIGWTGACSGTQPTCTLFIDDAKDVGAQFVDRFALVVRKSGAGSARVTSSPAGIDCGDHCLADFGAEGPVTLTIAPAADTYVESWGPGCDRLQSTCVIQVNTARSLEVVLGLKRQVSMSLIGNGRVISEPAGLDCNSSCSVWLDGGPVSVIATPAPGWHFVRWEGDCAAAAAAANCMLAAQVAVAASAVFAPDPVLTVVKAGNGSGTIQSSNGDISCAASCTYPLPVGTSYVLNATSGANSRFTGWGGACTGTGSCTLSLSADATVTATFSSAPAPGASGGSRGGGGQVGWPMLVVLSLMLASLARTRRGVPGTEAHQPKG